MSNCRSSTSFLIVAACLAPAVALATPSSVPGSASAAFASKGEDENTRAHAMYRQALELFKTQNYEASRELLLRLWQIRKTYDVASALGKTEMKLQLYRDAANHLRFCLDNFAPVSGKKVLDTIKQMMSETKTHVGTVSVKTNRDGAEVRIDGITVGIAPLKSPIYVDPGQHEVTVLHAGDKENEPIEVAPGQDINVDVPLERKAEPPMIANAPATGNSRMVRPVVARAPVAPLPPLTPVAAEHTRSLVPVVIGGAVFVAGVGTGIVSLLVANSQHSEATSLTNKYGAYGCYGSASSECSHQKSAWQSSDRYRNISTTGFVVAAAALLAVPIYWYWPRAHGSSASRSSTIQLRGLAGAQGSGLLISGEF